MRKPLIAALAMVLFVGACGAARESRLNPFNWFGRSEQTAAVAVETADTRPLVEQVVTLAVEPTSDGAIVRATGLPPTQGWWDGALVLYDSGREDTIAYRFVLAPPSEARRVSTPQSREVTVATHLSRIRLEGIRTITVTGAGNARSARR
ncbi:MAG: hypothetical protein WCZ72_11335 [Gemmobacter sp.]